MVGVAPLQSVTALAVISLALYVRLALLAPGNGWRDVGEFLAIMAALFTAYAIAFRQSERLDGRRVSLLIIGTAVLFRLALVPAGLPRATPLHEVLPLLASDLAGSEVVFERHLLFDDDHWRYLWDGHVAASGIDPYASAPDDRRLDAIAPQPGLWEEIRQNVNHSWLTTIYPPLTQLAFRLLHSVAPGSVVALKLLWIVADVLVMLLVGKTLALLGRPPALLLLYAWNPLVIKVTAGSAHFDILVALGVAALTYGVVAARRPMIACGWILAVAAKLTPAVFLLPIARRIGLARTVASASVIALLMVPMGVAGTGGSAFAGGWEFNATFFHAVKLLFAWTPDPGAWARGAVGLAVIAAAIWASRRTDPSAAPAIDAFADAALLPMAVLLLCGPVLMPWYVIWVLPLAAVARRIFWFQLTGIVQLAFLVMVDGRESPAILVVQAILTLVLIRSWLAQCTETSRGARP